VWTPKRKSRSASCPTPVASGARAGSRCRWRITAFSPAHTSSKPSRTASTTWSGCQVTAAKTIIEVDGGLYEQGKPGDVGGVDRVALAAILLRGDTNAVWIEGSTAWGKLNNVMRVKHGEDQTAKSRLKKTSPAGARSANRTQTVFLEQLETLFAVCTHFDHDQVAGGERHVSPSLDNCLGPPSAARQPTTVLGRRHDGERLLPPRTLPPRHKGEPLPHFLPAPMEQIENLHELLCDDDANPAA
jgi:hypothetical protein